MKTDFIPIDYDYFDFQGRNHAKIIGRNSKGKRICIIDSCPVYFWAILKDNLKQEKIDKLLKKIKKIKLNLKGRQTKVEAVELHEKNFSEKKVKAIKIFATNYKDLHDIADKLGMPEIEKRRGYDLGFTTHYIIEKKINPLCWYEISGEVLDNSEDFGGIGMKIDADMCIKLENAKKIKKDKFIPKVLAYDIEADELKIGEGEILMISLVSDGFKKVLTWKKTPHSKPNYVEYVKDEAELLEKFVEYVRKISPDFLVGYFSDGFGIVDADHIAIGEVGTTVQISSINYSTNTITLAGGILRSENDPVWLYKDSDGTVVLYGSAPDMGAEEYYEEGRTIQGTFTISGGEVH